MKNSRSLTRFLPLLMASCFVEVAEATESAAVAESTAGAPTESPAKRAAAANFLPIVRGRLPLLFVHAIRFDPVLKVMDNKALAAKFSTSVGKVFDIKKNRNFSYVGESFKPSAEDVTAAEAWIAQVGAQNAKGLAAQGDASLMTTTLESYKQRGLASADEAAAFSATRTATRSAATPAAGTAQAGSNVTATGGALQAGLPQTAGNADDLLG